MSKQPDLVTTYSFSCTVSALREPETSVLAQAGCSIQGDAVKFQLKRNRGEKSDQFRNRGAQWIARELSRVNVLTGRLLRATSITVEPSPGAQRIVLDPIWDHCIQKPPRHCGWLKPGAEFRLRAWDTASHTEDVILRFVMLDVICESAAVSQEWKNDLCQPPRFAEVRLLRNLLVHGENRPRDSELKYLQLLLPAVRASRFDNQDEHLKLAESRSPHLLEAVWNIVISDCVDIEIDLQTSAPASVSGYFITSRGPYPKASGTAD